jgi:hypothetical protein
MEAGSSEHACWNPTAEFPVFLERQTPPPSPSRLDRQLDAVTSGLSSSIPKLEPLRLDGSEP